MFDGTTKSLATSTSSSCGTAVPPAPFPFEESGPSLVRDEQPSRQPVSEEALGLTAGFPLTSVTPTVTSASGRVPSLIAGEPDQKLRPLIPWLQRMLLLSSPQRMS